MRDAVVAYLLALKRGKPGEVYNICSGNSYSIRSILDVLLSFSAKARLAKIVRDVSKTRKNDVLELVGSPSKFMKATGWVHSTPFERTLSDLLTYWRGNVT